MGLLSGKPPGKPRRMIRTRTGPVYDPNIAQCDAALADIVRDGWHKYRCTVDHILEVRYQLTAEATLRTLETR